MGLLAGIFLLATACSSDGYVITGKISGGEGKAVHLLTGNEEIMKVAIDSAVIGSDGRFEFRGELDAPALLTLKFFPDDTRGKGTRRYIFRPVIPLFVDKGRFEVEAAFDSIPLASFDRGYDYSRVRVTTPRLHELYAEYDREMTVLVAESRKFDDYIKYVRALKTPTPPPISEGIAAVARIDDATDATRDFVKRFIARNSNNAVGLHAFRENTGYKAVRDGLFTAAELDEILASFSPKMKQTTLYKLLGDEVNEVKKTAVGSPFMDFALKDAEGNPARLSDYAGKGRYVLLEFWASWCGPCRADIPHLKDLYELYYPAGFEVVSISLDEDKEEWTKAMEQEQMPWAQLHDDQPFQDGVAAMYGISGIPACMLVDPDGTIVDRNARGSWLDKTLIELYGNKFGKKY
jgi:peroxiredoxin